MSQAKAPQTCFLNGLCVAPDRADSSLAALTGSIAEHYYVTVDSGRTFIDDAIRTSEKTETQVLTGLMGVAWLSGYLQQLPTDGTPFCL